MSTDDLWDDFDLQPWPEVRRWGPWWPGSMVAWNDQHQHASQLVERHVYGDVPQVGTWDKSTSVWWAARHGQGAPQYECEHLEHTPGPAWVWMPYPAMRWCLSCWPMMATSYVQLGGGLRCHNCTNRLRTHTSRVRSLRYYEETLTAVLCVACARRWDAWGDGTAEKPGVAWAAYRDQDWDAHDAAWRARFTSWKDNG